MLSRCAYRGIFTSANTSKLPMSQKIWPNGDLNTQENSQFDFNFNFISSIDGVVMSAVCPNKLVKWEICQPGHEKLR